MAYNLDYRETNTNRNANAMGFTNTTANNTQTQISPTFSVNDTYKNVSERPNNHGDNSRALNSYNRYPIQLSVNTSNTIKNMDRPLPIADAANDRITANASNARKSYVERSKHGYTTRIHAGQSFPPSPTHNTHANQIHSFAGTTASHAITSNTSDNSHCITAKMKRKDACDTRTKREIVSTRLPSFYKKKLIIPETIPFRRQNHLDVTESGTDSSFHPFFQKPKVLTRIPVCKNGTLLLETSRSSSLQVDGHPLILLQDFVSLLNESPTHDPNDEVESIGITRDNLCPKHDLNDDVESIGIIHENLSRDEVEAMHKSYSAALQEDEDLSNASSTFFKNYSDDNNENDRDDQESLEENLNSIEGNPLDNDRFIANRNIATIDATDTTSSDILSATETGNEDKKALKKLMNNDIEPKASLQEDGAKIEDRLNDIMKELEVELENVLSEGRVLGFNLDNSEPSSSLPRSLQSLSSLQLPFFEEAGTEIDSDLQTNVKSSTSLTKKESSVEVMLKDEADKIFASTANHGYLIRSNNVRLDEPAKPVPLMPNDKEVPKQQKDQGKDIIKTNDCPDDVDADMNSIHAIDDRFVTDKKNVSTNNENDVPTGDDPNKAISKMTVDSSKKWLPERNENDPIATKDNMTNIPKENGKYHANLHKDDPLTILLTPLSTSSIVNVPVSSEPHFTSDEEQKRIYLKNKTGKETQNRKEDQSSKTLLSMLLGENDNKRNITDDKAVIKNIPSYHQSKASFGNNLNDRMDSTNKKLPQSQVNFQVSPLPLFDDPMESTNTSNRELPSQVSSLISAVVDDKGTSCNFISEKKNSTNISSKNNESKATDKVGGESYILSLDPQSSNKLNQIDPKNPDESNINFVGNEDNELIEAENDAIRELDLQRLARLHLSWQAECQCIHEIFCRDKQSFAFRKTFTANSITNRNKNISPGAVNPSTASSLYHMHSTDKAISTMTTKPKNNLVSNISNFFENNVSKTNETNMPARPLSQTQDKIRALHSIFRKSWAEHDMSAAINFAVKATRFLTATANGVSDKSIFAEVEWYVTYPILFVEVANILDNLGNNLERRLSELNEQEKRRVDEEERQARVWNRTGGSERSRLSVQYQPSHLTSSQLPQSGFHTNFNFPMKTSSVNTSSRCSKNTITGYCCGTRVGSEAVHAHGLEFDITVTGERILADEKNYSRHLGGLQRFDDNRSSALTGRDANAPLIVCQEWFRKALRIPDLVCRVYVEISLLNAFTPYFAAGKEGSKFLRESLMRITQTLWGIGHTLVSTYARSFLARWCYSFSVHKASFASASLHEIVHETAKKLLTDFFRSCPLMSAPKMEANLNKLNISMEQFMRIQAPAISWLIRAVVVTKPSKNRDSAQQEFQSLLLLYRSHCNSIPVLKQMLKLFDPSLYSRKALTILRLVQEAKVSPPSVPQKNAHDFLALSQKENRSPSECTDARDGGKAFQSVEVENMSIKDVAGNNGQSESSTSKKARMQLMTTECHVDCLEILALNLEAFSADVDCSSKIFRSLWHVIRLHPNLPLYLSCSNMWLRLLLRWEGRQSRTIVPHVIPTNQELNNELLIKIVQNIGRRIEKHNRKRQGANEVLITQYVEKIIRTVVVTCIQVFGGMRSNGDNQISAHVSDYKIIIALQYIGPVFNELCNFNLDAAFENYKELQREFANISRYFNYTDKKSIDFKCLSQGRIALFGMAKILSNYSNVHKGIPHLISDFLDIYLVCDELALRRDVGVSEDIIHFESPCQFTQQMNSMKELFSALTVDVARYKLISMMCTLIMRAREERNKITDISPTTSKVEVDGAFEISCFSFCKTGLSAIEEPIYRLRLLRLLVSVSLQSQCTDNGLFFLKQSIAEIPNVWQSYTNCDHRSKESSSQEQNIVNIIVPLIGTIHSLPPSLKHKSSCLIRDLSDTLNELDVASQTVSIVSLIHTKLITLLASIPINEDEMYQFGAPNHRDVDEIASRAFNTILNQVSFGKSESIDLNEMQSTILVDFISQLLISMKLDNEPSIKSFLFSLLDIYESGTNGSRTWAAQIRKIVESVN